RRAITSRAINDFISFEARDLLFNLIEQRCTVACFSATDSLQKLRARRRRLRDDVQLFVSPVRRHLATVRAWVFSRADCCEELFERRHAELQAECAVAVIRIKPIVAGLHRHACGDEDSFMACAANLEKYFILTFELNL